MYLVHLASYVIHELNYIPLFILESNTMLFLLVKPPFQLPSRHRMIAYPFETLVPSYSALNEFTEILLVGYFVYHFLNSLSDAHTSWRYVPPKFSPGRVRRTIEIPEKG